jgi:hypothetical protein
MDNVGKVISKAEVTETLVRNIVSDQQALREAIEPLAHGQKNRLIEAIINYPLVELEFSEEEPELRTSFTIYKRISDGLVALGTEAAIEGIINSFVKENNNSLTQGETNGETTEG